MRAYCHVMWSALEIAACHKGGIDPCALSGMAEIQLSKVNLSSRNNPCNINVPQTAQQRKGRERVSDVPGKRAGEMIVWERGRWERFLGMTVDSGLESFSTADQGTRCISTACMFAVQLCKQVCSRECLVMRAKHKRQPEHNTGYVHTANQWAILILVDVHMAF